MEPESLSALLDILVAHGVSEYADGNLRIKLRRRPVADVSAVHLPEPPTAREPSVEELALLLSGEGGS